MIVKKTTIADLKQIHQLINFYAHQHKMLARSLNELYENVRDFFVVKVGNKVIGCGALHISWENLAEIKAVAVHKSYRRRGIGKSILQSCLQEAKELGITRIFALTYTPDFFLKQGFKKIDRDMLPHKVWSECINCHLFPDCDEIAVLYEVRNTKKQ